MWFRRTIDLICFSTGRQTQSTNEKAGLTFLLVLFFILTMSPAKEQIFLLVSLRLHCLLDTYLFSLSVTSQGASLATQCKGSKGVLLSLCSFGWYLLRRVNLSPVKCLLKEEDEVYFLVNLLSTLFYVFFCSLYVCKYYC